jgi:predicted glycogen debranching enzyme
MSVSFGREITGDLAAAERREWLCTNGIGGFASGTVAGSLTRRYHGLLVAALAPPLGRTLLVSKVEEIVTYAGTTRELSTNRWVDGTVAPRGHAEIEHFRLDGTSPVWTCAVGDALLEKRVWMDQGANTTFVRYHLARASAPLVLSAKILVNHRDYHGSTRAGDWRMDVAPVADGVRVTAFAGARPVLIVAPGADVSPHHDWYRQFALPVESARGLDAVEDHLHAATVHTTLTPGGALTIVLSAEADPPTDGAAAWQRRQRHEADVLERWRHASPEAGAAPAFIRQLVLAADQFVVARPHPDDAHGVTVIAGYHWFGDWGRDTMIALPGLTLATGRPDAAARILRTFARFVDRGMLPNRFPDGGEAPEYNTVDATLWFVEAIRAHHAATGDDAVLKDLFPALESIVQWHRKGTRYGIAEDPADGLLRAGEPGVQLTWMDARLGDWVVTPRMGKPVEINALWYNALRAMGAFAARLGRPVEPWSRLADRVQAGFQRFWHASEGHCFDVIDGPGGDDPALRPNQVFAVSLPASPFDRDRQRAIVDACARHLLTSYGLRSLAPGHPAYCRACTGSPAERDGAYHQGTVWGWLLGPFALAHFKVYGDADLARGFLAPLADHLADFGLGSIAEIFDAEPPFTPRGCIAQAWSVAETLRAWQAIGKKP